MHHKLATLEQIAEQECIPVKFLMIVYDRIYPQWERFGPDPETGVDPVAWREIIQQMRNGG